MLTACALTEMTLQQAHCQTLQYLLLRTAGHTPTADLRFTIDSRMDWLNRVVTSLHSRGFLPGHERHDDFRKSTM